jgi:hypothetical protein
MMNCILNLLFDFGELTLKFCQLFLVFLLLNGFIRSFDKIFDLLYKLY